MNSSEEVISAAAISVKRGLVLGGSKLQQVNTTGGRVLIFTRSHYVRLELNQLPGTAPPQ